MHQILSSDGVGSAFGRASCRSGGAGGLGGSFYLIHAHVGMDFFLRDREDRCFAGAFLFRCLVEQ